MPCADSLDIAKDKEFRLNYAKAYKLQPDVYAVQGYDAAQLFDVGLRAVKGDIKAAKAMIAAMEGVTIDSPRGKWKMSRAHNPIQDSYLRQVVGEQNKYVSVAWKALEDPARGCKLLV